MTQQSQSFGTRKHIYIKSHCLASHFGLLRSIFYLYRKLVGLGARVGVGVDVGVEIGVGAGIGVGA
jgi:hypothetical protein